MDLFWSGLYRMLVRFEVIRIQDNEFAIPIFAVGCAVIGVLAVLGDLALFVIRGESLLKLKHGPRNTLFFGLAWAGGALIFGYIGQAANVFQVSLLACVTVGTAWPVVFARVLEKAKKSEDEQQPSSEDKV